MMKRRSPSVHGRMTEDSAKTTSSKEEEVEWEMRPGGMLVQRRTDQFDRPAKNVLVRVNYGAVRFELPVNSQATFGELKKLLVEKTGLQAGEQKLVFRGKDRENGEYLDTCGVKDKSKVILIEDPYSRGKRLIEMRKNAKIQTAHRAISAVSTEVDQLADQVSAIEKSISNGMKVAEIQITTLTEMLMKQAIKLDGISTEGTDASDEKNLQGKRVQKCVEKLDELKIENTRVKPVIVTTKWETFEFDPPPTTANWEFFD